MNDEHVCKALDFDVSNIDPKTIKIGFNVKRLKNLIWLNALASTCFQMLDSSKEIDEVTKVLLEWNAVLEKYIDFLEKKGKK